MYKPVLVSMMRAMKARRVTELRMVRLAWRGRDGWAEVQSMVVGKVSAAGRQARMRRKTAT